MIIPYIIIGMIFLVITINLVSAEQTVKTVELPIGYVAQTSANQDYITTKTIDSPDGIAEIISFEIIIKGDFQSDTDIKARIRKFGDDIVYDCDPSSWVTPSMNVPNYETSFDCSSLAHQFDFKTGKIDLGMRTDKVAQNLKGSLRVTYYNKPKAVLTLHGTEYVADQDAKVWLQLLNENNSNIDNAVCYLDIHSPYGTAYIGSATMESLDHNGIYYYDLVAPTHQGVYPAVALCYYEAERNYYYFNNSQLLIGTGTGSVLNTWVLDSSTYNIKEDNYGGTKRLDVIFNITSSFCGNYSEELLTGVTIGTYSRWASTYPNDDITFLFYNWTNSSWQSLPNKLYSGISGYQTITNSLSINNITTSGIANNGKVRLRLADTNLTETSTDNLDVDYLYASCDSLSNPEWTSVKGSSELHISSDKNYIPVLLAGNLTNETFNGYFYLDYVIGSATVIDRTNQLVELEMFTAFPCAEIINVSVKNATGDYVSYNFSTREEADGRCTVSYYQELDSQENYDVRIKAYNFWKKDLYPMYQEALMTYDIIQIGCENYQEANGLPDYEVPLISKPNLDNLYNSCNYYYDLFYEFNESINKDFAFDTGYFNSEQMKNIESHYEYYHDLGVLTQLIGNTIKQGWILADSFSLAILNDPYPPTNPNYSLYFSQITTSYYQYLKTSNISNEVWSYTPNRTLTNFNFTVEANVNETKISESVWSYTGTISANILSQLTSQVWNYTSTIAENILTQISNTIWEEDDRNLTYYPAQEDLTNYTLITELIENSTDITNYTLIEDLINNRNLTDLTNYTRITDDTWAYENRTLTVGSGHVGGTEYSTDEPTGRIVARILDGGGNPVNDANCTVYIYYPTNVSIYLTLTMNKGNQTQTEGVYYADFNHSGLTGVHAYMIDCYKGGQDFYLLGSYHVFEENTTKFAEAIWNYPSRNLTFYNLTEINLTEIADAVWTYVDRNLTFYEYNNLTASDIWNYVSRNLTYYNQTEQVDLTDYNRIQELVWNATMRNLTYYEVTEINETAVAVEVWQYENRNLTYYASTLSAEEIWNYTDRNLTYYETTPINYTLISESVWDYINRTLSDFAFTVEINESAVADAVWDAVNRTLTEFNFTVDVDNSAVADAVWNATTRTLTDYNQTAQIDLTDYNRIQELVWNATDRNLTYYETTDIDYNQIQDMVWNATVRTLTDFNFTASLNESIIAQAVWDAVNRTLTDYNQTDLTDYNRIYEGIWNATTRTLTGFSFTVDIDESEIWSYSNRTLTYYETADVSNLTVNINSSAVADAVWNYNGTVNSNLLNQIADKVQCYIENLFEDEEEWGVEIKVC